MNYTARRLRLVGQTALRPIFYTGGERKLPVLLIGPYPNDRGGLSTVYTVHTAYIRTVTLAALFSWPEKEGRFTSDLKQDGSLGGPSLSCCLLA